MSSDRWVIHKFGGTSVASGERYRHVGRLLAGRPEPRRAVVVSAMRGVTDALFDAVDLAGRRDAAYRDVLDAVGRRHREAILELVGQDAARELLDRLERDLSDIADVLHATWLLRSHSRGILELVSGYGEVWSARCLAAHLEAHGQPAACMDARDVLVTVGGGERPDVDWATTRGRLGAWFEAAGPLPPTLVITGFVASSADGVPTTLGRDGSDFSASIFATLLDAEEIHIWTDVDGVMSADPRLVPEAVLLESLSYDEAMELAYFGAKVIHPSTMAPAVEHAIPIFIRNTFNPEHPGTRIHVSGGSRFAVKGFAAIPDVALVNLEGTGMIGVPGTAERLFGALRDAGVSVIMISQGSSEHSICFAVPQAAGSRAREAAERAFFAERHHGQILTVELVDDCCILAVVGDGMAGYAGVAGKFFGSLGRAGINVRAIAQGSSERNISVVIDGPEASRALRAVHAGFYLSSQTLSIGVIGTGVVGGALLDQLGAETERLRRDFNLDLRVRAIATSARMLLAEGRLDLGDWRDALRGGAVAVDPAQLADHVQADHLPHAVLIDCTASEAVAGRYADWLRRGIHVVTPNKRANTGELDYYRELRRTGRSAGAHYLYETTVGAGLPIVQTLRDLIQTGDEVLEIEGVLSGTLSYLFNLMDGRRPFSAIVEEARAQGYTEPDPRDDLSGADVARKVVILAREMGLPLDLDQVEVDSLVPAELRSGNVAEFLEALPDHDQEMERQLREATASGGVLRFIGTVDRDGRASARLRAVPADHAFARIRTTDNIVQFRTRRYHDNPLVVQGPGAGPEVTAAGVFADLLRLSAYLGATL
jgi:bifunctional aspartokinase / homoserine dehydrogenase 1